MLNITDKNIEDKIIPVFRLGFRPFFLLGGIYAPIAIAIWVYAFQHGQPKALQVPAIWWHVHEMIFGFAMAIVAGFLLTAVQNWTGINGTKDKRLMLIVALWLAPRMLFWTATPLWIIATIETLFLAAVAYEISTRVIQVKSYRNLIFLPFFALAIIANVASYSSILPTERPSLPTLSSIAVWQAMLWWFMLLISIMGGRVIPFFTAKKMGFEKPQPLLWLDIGANLPLLILFILSFFPSTAATVNPWLMLFTGFTQTIRFIRWQPWRTFKEPLLWSLHTSYFCLPLGLLLQAIALNGWISNGLFIAHNLMHLLAIGAMTGVILAMICRVTMGHTGRNIYQGPNMTWAFIAIILAALIRAFGVAWWPQHVFHFIHISSTLWVFAFAMFVVKFGYMLIQARADGHPG